MGELLKLPDLGRHYLEHRQLDSQISLAKFLAMHYLGQDLKDQDAEKDMKLPFKKIAHGATSVLFQNSVKNLLLIINTEPTCYSSFYRTPFIKDSDLDQLYKPPQGLLIV